MTFSPDAWFGGLAAAARQQPDAYRVLGFADLRLVLEVTEDGRARRYGLVLDGYDVEYRGKLDDLEAFHADATLSGPLEAWAEMADNIDANRGADGLHTLNALSIAEAPLRVEANDPIGRDKFFRYAQTLQELFDGAVTRPAAV